MLPADYGAAKHRADKAAQSRPTEVPFLGGPLI
jgi:hypothetical protein